MKNRLIFLAVFMALAACAAGPQPHLAGPVKDVPTADQAQYWVVDHTSIGKDIPGENGCFRVKTLIDSDGKLYQPKVLAVVGPDISAWLPGFLAKLRFAPAPGNAARTPIRTVLTWTLTREISTQSVPAASAAAAVAAAMEKGPPPDALGWGDKCKAEMDKQMGITAAPSAATAH